MGTALSKLQISKFDIVIKLWTKSTYFRVSITMITFLIARGLYNKFRRIYSNLPLNIIKRTGLPLIGCIPYLLVNTYTRIIHGDIAEYNLGFQQNTLFRQNTRQTLSIFDINIANELDTARIIKCIKQYILQKHNNFHDIHNIIFYTNNLHQSIKLMVLNITMIICFGITIDKSSLNKQFYMKWDAATRQIRDTALLTEPHIIYSFINKCFGIRQKYHHKNNYLQLWQQIYDEYIEKHLENNDIINTENVFCKLKEKHKIFGNKADLFMIAANAMNLMSSCLEWCIMSLCKYPVFQNKIYSEIYDACNGNVKAISADTNISVLKAFVFDNLRLYPFGSLPRFRCNSSNKPIQIQLNCGKIYTVPPDGVYAINLYTMTYNSINLDLWFDQIGFGQKTLIFILSLLIFKYTFTFKESNDENDIKVIIVKRQRDNDIVKSQDMEYNRAFIKDLSVNPFRQNPFKKKKKKEKQINIAFCDYFGSAAGCKQGRFCVFSHSNPNYVSFCKWFNSRWGCKNEHKCNYRHTQFARQQFHALPEIKMVSRKKMNFSEKRYECTSMSGIIGLNMKDNEIKSSLNCEAIEFIPHTAAGHKLENENELEAVQKLHGLAEIEMIGNREISTTENVIVVMPPIHENIELDLAETKSKLNKNAKEFVPIFRQIIIGGDETKENKENNHEINDGDAESPQVTKIEEILMEKLKKLSNDEKYEKLDHSQIIKI